MHMKVSTVFYVAYSCMLNHHRLFFTILEYKRFSDEYNIQSYVQITNKQISKLKG